MYKLIVRPILFLMDPEKVHHLTFSLIRVLGKLGLTSLYKSTCVVENQALEGSFWTQIQKPSRSCSRYGQGGPIIQ